MSESEKERYDMRCTPRLILLQTGFLLLLLLFVEWTGLWLTNNFCEWGGCWKDIPCCAKVVLCCAASALLFIMILIVIGCRGNFYRRPSADLVSNLFSNSVKGNGVKFVIMLFFFANVTWLIDCLYYVFIESDLMHLIPAVIPVASMVILLHSYPYMPHRIPEMSEKKVIVSAMSCGQNGIMSWRNVDLLLKPYCDTAFKQDERPKNIGTHVVVPSMDRIDSIQNVTYFSADDTPAEILGHEANINKLVDAYNDSVKSLQKLAEFFQAVVKEISGMDVKFEIENSCDYDDFDSLNARFQVALNYLDSDETLLYISPGTANASSSLAILSLVGGRTILYQSQSEKLLKAVYVSPASLKEWYRDLLKGENDS